MEQNLQGFCGNPIQAAANGGDPETVGGIVRMLLDFRANPIVGSGYYGSLLQSVAVSCNAE